MPKDFSTNSIHQNFRLRDLNTECIRYYYSTSNNEVSDDKVKFDGIPFEKCPGMFLKQGENKIMLKIQAK